MAILKLKGEHKPIREYYAALEQYERIGAKDEGAVRIAFQNLLDACGRQFNWTVQAEYSYTRADKRAAKIDGALVDEFRIARGYWEAKDVKDNLDKASE
jgi:hypothetical protein